MIVVIAGSGSSRAVSKDYPTTVEFVAQLPAAMKLDDGSLLGRVHQALSEEKSGAPVDIEEILGRLVALREFAAEIRANNLFMKTFRPSRGVSVPAPLGEWVERLLGLQHSDHFERFADILVGELRERLWLHYSTEPKAEGLEATWMPLLRGLLELDDDVELYTLNYDRVLDVALDALPRNSKERHRIERGIYPSAGAFRVQTDTWRRSADDLRQGSPNYVLYTKLHGSLNWVKDEKRIVTGAWTQPPRNLAAAAIVYPELGKDASSESPFREFYQRLQASVGQASYVLSVGYAHRDPPIEAMLKDQRSAPLTILNPAAGIVHGLLEAGFRDTEQISEGLTRASAQQVLDRIRLASA
ncbi:MAG: SIR2 family protein [Planctomycetota bacterium]